MGTVIALDFIIQSTSRQEELERKNDWENYCLLRCGARGLSVQPFLNLSGEGLGCERFLK